MEIHLSAHPSILERDEDEDEDDDELDRKTQEKHTECRLLFYLKA